MKLGVQVQEEAEDYNDEKGRRRNKEQYFLVSDLDYNKECKRQTGLWLILLKPRLAKAVPGGDRWWFLFCCFLGEE